MPLASCIKQTGTTFLVGLGVRVRIPFLVCQCLEFLGVDCSLLHLPPSLATFFLILNLFLPLAALKTEGVFRKPGNTKRVAELQLHFETKPMVPVDFSKYSVHDVAGVLKRYFRDLPEPIFTFRLQNLFFSTQGTKELHSLFLFAPSRKFFFIVIRDI